MTRAEDVARRIIRDHVQMPTKREDEFVKEIAQALVDAEVRGIERAIEKVKLANPFIYMAGGRDKLLDQLNSLLHPASAKDGGPTI